MDELMLPIAVSACAGVFASLAHIGRTGTFRPGGYMAIGCASMLAWATYHPYLVKWLNKK